MHFDKIVIPGFGCLKTVQPITFSPHKLNLIIANNEEGKSTLVAAILAAFYGVETDRRKTTSPKPFWERYRPWKDPHQFGLELFFQYDHHPWHLVRNFSQLPLKLHLYHLPSGKDRSREFLKSSEGLSIGEALLGLTLEEFLKSFLLRQDEFEEVSEARVLVPQVQRIATSLEGKLTAQQVIDLLEGFLKAYPVRNRQQPLTIENVISRLNRMIEKGENEIRRLTTELTHLEESYRNLIERERSLDTKENRREELLKEADWAEIRELDEIVRQQSDLIKELQTYQEELASLEFLADFPAHQTEELNKKVGELASIRRELEEKRRRFKEEILKAREELEKSIQEVRLGGVGTEDIQTLQNALTRLQEKEERWQDAYREYEENFKQVEREGINRDLHENHRQRFAQLDPQHLRFLEDFERQYREGEGTLREVTTRRELREQERESLSKRVHRISLTASLFFWGALGCGFAGGIVLYSGLWVWQIFVGLALILAAMGIILKATAGTPDRATFIQLTEEIRGLSSQEESIKAILDQLKDQLAELTAQTQFENGFQMLEAFSRYLKDERWMEPLRRAEQNCDQARVEFMRALEELAIFFHRAELPVPKEAEAVEEGEKLLGLYRKAYDLGEKYRQLKRREDDLRTEIARLEEWEHSFYSGVASILQSGGLEAGEPLEEKVRAFNDKNEKYQRYRHLKEVIIPNGKSRILNPQDRSSKEERREQLMKRWGLTSLPPAMPYSKEHYREEAERLDREIREEKKALDQERLTLKSRYDHLHSEKGRWLNRVTQWEEMREEVKGFKEAIEIAKEKITEISHNIYQTWSEALSQEANAFLRVLNPRYEDFSFDGQLGFRMWDKITQRSITSEEVKEYLSAGAKDEIYLAARLAIARFITRGIPEPLPILLDEPLASADDQKFQSGMKFFLEELSRQHQVIILTCHEERHRWLREQAPELFDARVHNIYLSQLTSETPNRQP